MLYIQRIQKDLLRLMGNRLFQSFEKTVCRLSRDPVDKVHVYTGKIKGFYKRQRFFCPDCPMLPSQRPKLFFGKALDPHADPGNPRLLQDLKLLPAGLPRRRLYDHPPVLRIYKTVLQYPEHPLKLPFREKKGCPPADHQLLKHRSVRRQKLLILPALTSDCLQITVHLLFLLPCDREQIAVPAFGPAERKMQIQPILTALQTGQKIMQRNSLQRAVGRLMRVTVHILYVWIHSLFSVSHKPLQEEMLVGHRIDDGMVDAVKLTAILSVAGPVI